MNRRWIRGLALIAGAAAIGLTLYFSPAGARLFDATRVVETMRKYSDRWWIIPAYVLAYATLDVLFIPTQFLSIAAVLIWGWVKGGTIELLSATFGALFPYLIARSTLRESVVARLRKHETIFKALERDSFTLLLLLRVVPIIPYTALNYVAGLTSMTTQRYLLATLLGIIPSTYIFAYFVDATVQGVMAPRDVIIRVIAAGALLATLIIATRLAAPRVRRRMSSEGRTSPPPASADRD